MNAISTKRRLHTALLAACALACAVPATQAGAMNLFGWGGEQVQGSGNVVRQGREVGHFSGLSLTMAGNVELRTGAAEGVTGETDDNLQQLVETVVENGTLKIRPAKRHANLRPHTLKIVVTARSIDRLALAGSGTIDADALRAPKLDLDVGGSGTISIRSIDSDAVSASVAGSGELKANGGSARQLTVSIAGSGNADLGQLKAASASVRVAGSGDATVWATGNLGISIAGSGDIGYYGDPALSRSIVGSGEVRRLGAAPR